jgi:hypothetical protein
VHGAPVEPGHGETLLTAGRAREIELACIGAVWETTCDGCRRNFLLRLLHG